jgi:hypothetical protein
VRYPSAVFVLVGLAVAIGCSRLATKGVVVDSSFDPFIPADTKVLAGVHIAKLEAAPLYNSHKEQLNLAQLQAFSERTGLDPTRDLSEILITWDGRQSLLMARGRFSQSKVGPKLESLGARRRSYKNYTLFGDDRNSLVFLNDGLVVAGPSQSLRHVIDGRDKSHTGIPAELQQQLETIPKADQIWAVSSGGLPVSGIPMRSDIDSALSNIVGYVSGTAMGVGIDTGIHLQADLTCISDQGAQRVRDALRGGLGLARLTTKDNQLDLLRLYDAVHVDQENSLIHVRADLAPDLANKLLSYIPQMKNGGGRMFEKLPSR